MNIFELLLLGIGLAMDAFAVSICKGLSMKKISLKKMIIVGLYFGFFQAVMPLIGYFLGISFANFVTSFDHWIAFFLLLFIGGNMIKDCFFEKEEENSDDLGIKTMLLLAIATSIDALAVGITFAFLKVNLVFAVSIIGVITFVLSLFGVLIGHVFGDKFEKKAQLLGGIILILIGTKILMEHLGVL